LANQWKLILVAKHSKLDYFEICARRIIRVCHSQLKHFPTTVFDFCLSFFLSYGKNSQITNQLVS